MDVVSREWLRPGISIPRPTPVVERGEGVETGELRRLGAEGAGRFNVMSNGEALRLGDGVRMGANSLEGDRAGGGRGDRREGSIGGEKYDVSRSLVEVDSMVLASLTG